MAQLAQTTAFKPMEYNSGQLVKIIQPIETRRQNSLAPKLIPQAILAYFLCNSNTSSMHYVYSFATNTCVYANKIELVQMDSINFKNPLVATTSIADPFGYQLPTHHVDKSLLTVQKQITAKQVLEIGVHIDTNTEERYGAIKVLLHGTDKKQWVLLETFLKGRKDRTYIHYNLLTQFLDQHFKHRQKIFSPFICTIRC